MKLLSTLTAIILFGIINLHASSDVVQRKYIRFIEKANGHTETFQNQGIPDMSLRYFDDTKWVDSELKITCDDISENGIGSSYLAHTFSLSKANENVSNYNWKFSLKDKSGNYTLISTASTENFTIEKISSPQDYFININEDLEGRIECEYTLNGKEHNTTSFALFLELKPSIISIDNISVINNGPYDFYLTFDVTYVGADYVAVEIEEEYNSTLRNYHFYEPYFAHVKTGNISNLYYSWVTIIVSNKYGSTSETLEYAPSTGSTQNNTAAPITKTILLYNINGNVVFDGTPTDFLNQQFQPGLYIKKEILDNGSTKNTKIRIK